MYYTINSLLLTVTFLFSMFRLPDLLRNRDCIALSEPKFKKLVYLVIDGLRFDGFVPVDKKGLYFNNFSFTKDIDKLRTTFLSVASIPTVTKCRITGLMTGAPNNQIEEVLSFFMSKVNVDAFPDKFADRKMKFYGDDLWVKSFDVLKDCSSTFCGFSKNSLQNKELMLIDEIRRDKDYDIKFIHIISLDALGHIYGTNHPEIKDALHRADKLICQIYEDMDDETLFVITSDHGVTDQGSHGGSSKYEMASVCGFYTKKIPMFNTSEYIYNEEFIKKFYDVKDVNSENDWIRPITPYKIIQQDDILPTTSYFMGVSTPANTYGNLIPYLVDDMKAQKILINQKLKILKEDIQIEKKDSLIEFSYEITKHIYGKLSKTYPLIAFVSLTFGIIMLLKLYFSIKSIAFFSFFSIIVSVIMVSHSYWSFASEDYVWGFVYVINNPSICNLIFVLAYLISPGRVFFDNDKISLVIVKNLDIDILYSVSDFIEEYRYYIFVGLMVLFFISKFKSKAFIKNCKKILPQLMFILCALFFDMKCESKITFLCSYPSVESILTVHLKPTIVILFIYFIENLDFNLTQTNRFILLQLTTFALSIEKIIPSINFEVFFALSDIYGSISCYTGLFAYLVIPRYLIIRKMMIDNQGRLLEMFGLFFCYACSWFMRISIVFQNFFIGRLLFTIMLFFTDRAIESLMRLQRKYFIIRKTKNLKSL